MHVREAGELRRMRWPTRQLGSELVRELEPRGERESTTRRLLLGVPKVAALALLILSLQP